MESQPTAPEAPLLPLFLAEPQLAGSWRLLASDTSLAGDDISDPWLTGGTPARVFSLFGFFLTLPALKTEPWDARAVCPSRQGSGIIPTGVGTKCLDFAAFIAPVSDKFIVNVICGVGLHAVHP